MATIPIDPDKFLTTQKLVARRRFFVAVSGWLGDADSGGRDGISGKRAECELAHRCRVATYVTAEWRIPAMDQSAKVEQTAPELIQDDLYDDLWYYEFGSSEVSGM